MDHLAIMLRNAWWIEKILSGEKKIESRWYKHKRLPFKKIKPGEIIYFKESCGPVIARAEVERVLFYENLDVRVIRKIIDQYGKQICIDQTFGDEIIRAQKRYASLLFLKNQSRVDSFTINKKGYASGDAWLSIEDINKIRNS